MNDIDLPGIAFSYTSNIIIIGSSLRNDAGDITDFTVLFGNRRVEELTGLPVNEIIGQSIRSIVAFNPSSTFWEQAVDVVQTGIDCTIDSQLTNQFGETLWVSTAIHRYADGIVLVFSDTTQATLAEQELLKKIDELQRSNQNLEQFAYVASHDLQEPLRKIIAFGDVLQNQYATRLDEPGVDLLKRMRLATQRMQELIKNLLSFSRSISVHDPFTRVNLQEIVDEVISDLEPIIHEKKAVLDITSLPYLAGDPGQLRQLFQNLLSNALKFIRPNDIPLIRLDCEVIQGSSIKPMPGTTVLTTDLNRSFFAFIVSDNGIGFDEKYLDRIFTIFQRLHNRKDFPGTGIGLAVVRQVIENHKGYLNARSQPGQGAEFTVYLPDEPEQISL